MGIRRTLASRIGRIKQEDGLGLVEVMVSAVLLLVVATTVLGTIDHSSKLSGRLKAKAASANLAQQDQERLRSLRPAQLANLYEVRNLTVNSANYEVTSTGTFVSEATQTPGCTSTARADFVKITSTVRTKGMQGLRPVHLESLINPAVGSFGGSLGSMVVQVRNAAGAPVAGLPVAIAGPGSYTQPTSAEGCAFFAYVPVGAYSFSYASPGWVNQSGENAISQPATVKSDQTASYQTVYDQAAAVQATFETRVDGVAQAGKGEALTMVHPNIPGDGSRVFEPDTAPAASVDATGLFPFPSKYGIYAGSCAANALPAALLASLPAGRYQSEMLLAPGQGYAALLFEPAIDLRVKHNGTDAADANVYASATATGCGGTVVQKTGAAGSGFEGRLLDPGYPHGTWDLCAEMTVAPGIRSHAIVTGVVNDQLEGVDVNIDIPTSAVDSPCVV